MSLKEQVVKPPTSGSAFLQFVAAALRSVSTNPVPTLLKGVGLFYLGDQLSQGIPGQQDTQARAAQFYGLFFFFFTHNGPGIMPQDILPTRGCRQFDNKCLLVEDKQEIGQHSPKKKGH